MMLSQCTGRVELVLLALLLLCLRAQPVEFALLDKPAAPSIYNTETWVPLTHKTQEASPLPPISDSWSDPTAEIFVGIVHYRDFRCPHTIKDLFDKAQYPDRVRVGVVEQKHTEEEPRFSCILEYCRVMGKPAETNKCPHFHQLTLVQFSHNSARGPSYARFMQQGLRQGEEFCMQVDSHSNFAQNWDTLQLTMWAQTENENAVLSSLAPDISALRRSKLNEESQEVPHLCQAAFDDR
jgi:hypothetical protein